MFQNESRLLVADNSGAKEVLIISNQRSRIGDVVTVTIKESKPNKFTKKVEKVVKALIITSKRGFWRKNGSFISFSENYAILLERKKKEELKLKLNKKERKVKPRLLGTRILVPVLREFGDWGWKEVLSLTKQVI